MSTFRQLILKCQHKKDKMNISRTSSEIIYERRKNRLISDFPSVTLLPRMQLNNGFSVLKKNDS